MAEYLQVPPAAEVIVKNRRLENRADFLQRVLAVLRDIEPAHSDFSLARPNLSQHHADGGAFARAIVAQQPEDFASGHSHGEITDRLALAEKLGNISEFDHGEVP